MHSHLLPDVDDGVKNISEGIHYIEQLVALGYRKLIITPHIYRDFYPNSKADLELRFAAFEKEVNRAGISIELELGAEYYLDDHFSALLEKDEILFFGSKKYVLVETSFVGLPLNLRDSLFDLTTNGYVPVLAHPERYTYLNQNLGYYNQLTEMGVLLQINLGSMVGHYGKIPAEICKYLIQERLVSFVGTDLHHQRHLDNLTQLSATSNLTQLKNLNLLNRSL